MDQPTEDRIKKTEGTPDDILKKLDAIGTRLDQIDHGLTQLRTKQEKFSTDMDELKLDAKAYIGDAAIFKNKVERMEEDVSTIKTDIKSLPTKEEVEALLIRYLHPGGNGHKEE